MEIVLCGRNVEVPQHFREHTTEKLSRVERYDHKIVRMVVELSHEPNPRQAKSCQRVEITGRGRGPVVRGEACASDFYCALDQAVARLEARLRRSHDRRVNHVRRAAAIRMHSARAGSGAELAAVGTSVLARPENDLGTALEPDALVDAPIDPPTDLRPAGGAALRMPRPRAASDDVPAVTDPAIGDPSDDLPEDPTAWDPPDADDDNPVPGRIARRKEHHAIPMNVDDALSQMELVGHDFFLFADAATGRPSVVYRRHGYDYGVIALA